MSDDIINHPSHYTAGGVECIDAIEAALCKYTDPVDAWLAGQVVKYLGKAKFYLDRLAARLDAKEKEEEE